MATEYKPGDKVERSGIYRVIHDDEHTKEHEVTWRIWQEISAMQSLW
jgi:hypothetical protein